MHVRTSFKEFLKRFTSRGGDITRLSYDMSNIVREEYTRGIIGIHSGGFLKVRSNIKGTYVVNSIFMEVDRIIDLAPFKPAIFPCRSARTSTVLLLPRDAGTI